MAISKKSYILPVLMLCGILSGSIVGMFWSGATIFAPLGKIFINLMLCIVVPLIFASISSSIANMDSPAKTGKIIAITIAIFIITGTIASIIMIFAVTIFPPAPLPWENIPAENLKGSILSSDLIVSFFTTEEFGGLLSSKAILPLILFSMIFGLGVNLNGGKDSLVGKFLEELSNVMIKVVKIITYFAPIAFFGFFADMVATYGDTIAKNYLRALTLYYPICIIYMISMFPLFAFIGGGREGVKIMSKNILRPVIVSLGTCSSIATLPTNMEVAKESKIPKDVANTLFPLGATMHMDGSCLASILKIAFLFGIFGIPFGGFETLLLAVGITLLASIGMSGIPGGGYIGEFIICSIFFPDNIELAYPIAITIGNLIDPPATVINASGDYAISFIVSRFTNGKNWLKDRIK